MKTLLSSLYNLLPFKHRLFQIMKFFWKPSERIFRHLHFKGLISVPLKGSSFKMQHYGFQLENELFWSGVEGGWEKYSMALWCELSQKSEVVFDIGANTGVYALVTKCLNKEARVLAFEPVERVFEKLEKNVELNNYSIECYRQATSNFNGTATIYDRPTDHIYSVTVNKDLNEVTTDSIPVEIETITLDTVIKNKGIQKIDLMKIDVETHEVEVLEGFKEHLETFQPTMLIEILTEEVAKGVENIVKDLGYLYFNIDEVNGIRRVDHLGKSDYYNFFLCKPEVAQSLNVLKDHV